jgi:hypothetical protein
VLSGARAALRGCRFPRNAQIGVAAGAGANTAFTIDPNDTVTLDNVTKTSLTAGNFHFA